MAGLAAGMSRTQDDDLPIAFVGTYPPRRCGIATFTRDLGEATAMASERVLPMTLALTDPGGQYEYPGDVKYEIRQAVRADYAHAAEFVNYSDVKLVSIQHEYGIYGGQDGAYVLDFLSALRVPALVTLHTLLKEPSLSQRNIVQRIATQAAGLVVMSGVAEGLLASAYDVQGANVHVIPHGIPAMEPRDPQKLKAKFGVPGHRMLLTFGLIGPNKGIETVIRALPAIVAEFPDVIYFVVGATHPAILRQDAEAYRSSLEREAEKLGVREHIVFRNQYVTREELCRYLQAADIFISPYMNEAQITSGALSYAMGAGLAVVSTPYWHAQELLAEGRGCLFPFRDSAALSRTVSSLLGSKEEFDRVRSRAMEFSRNMIWPNVGRSYYELGARLVDQVQSSGPRRAPTRAVSVPDLRLDHLLRMSDDTGIIQHATHSVPARTSGYCVDDNARALIVALHADRMHNSPEARRLITTYLSYLHYSQTSDGSFKNFMSYSRILQDSPASDDCVGRALWALGATMQQSADPGCRQLAREMFARALPRASELGPRGTALTILGVTHYLTAEPGATSHRAVLEHLAEKLVHCFEANSSERWRWFETTLTYDNAMLPLSLFKAYLSSGERSFLRVARESLEFLEQICFVGERLELVGNAGWHRDGGVKAIADEQPIDAAAFVLAYRGAYLATGDRHYIRRMREAFAWFLGSNRLGLPLYDGSTGGCRDGLGAIDVNQNQGAESSLSFLLSQLAMMELTGEGMQYADPYSHVTN